MPGFSLLSQWIQTTSLFKTHNSKENAEVTLPGTMCMWWLSERRRGPEGPQDSLRVSSRPMRPITRWCLPFCSHSLISVQYKAFQMPHNLCCCCLTTNSFLFVFAGKILCLMGFFKVGVWGYICLYSFRN